MSLFTNLLGGALDLVNGFSSYKTAKLNNDLALQQNDLMYQNFNLAQQNYEYQKDLQSQIFQREDSAVQRRVEDLRKAGLSPVLAAGSAADSGSVVSTSTPQYGGLTKRQAFQLDMSNSLNLLNAMTSIAGQKLDNEIKAYNLGFARDNALPYGQANNQYVQLVDTAITRLSDLYNKYKNRKQNPDGSSPFNLAIDNVTDGLKKTFGTIELHFDNPETGEVETIDVPKGTKTIFDVVMYGLKSFPFLFNIFGKKDVDIVEDVVDNSSSRGSTVSALSNVKDHGYYYDVAQ